MTHPILAQLDLATARDEIVRGGSESRKSHGREAVVCLPEWQASAGLCEGICATGEGAGFRGRSYDLAGSGSCQVGSVPGSALYTVGSTSRALHAAALVERGSGCPDARDRIGGAAGMDKSTS